MIHFYPLALKHKSLILQWFKNDREGQKELSSYADFEAWYKIPNSPVRFKWIINQSTRAIGFVDLEKTSKDTGSFSFYLAQTERGKGLSKELLAALIQEARKLGIKELIAGVNEENIPSQKALTSAKFTTSERDKDNYLVYKLKL